MTTKSDLNAEILSLCGGEYEDNTLSGRRNLHIDELRTIRDKIKDLKEKLQKEQEKQREKDERIIELERKNENMRTSPGIAYQ